MDYLFKKLILEWCYIIKVEAFNRNYFILKPNNIDALIYLI